ncbi:Dcp1-like decapping [Penicillium capsulatum]|uniref:Dcp1-like decapping n=1 Tax=Penicillium capsulatum TaxID=69766 RepID=A0A9W9IP46_9EURO|nr:Dcp1-like decapping [Penicillium capsulatum]KAJ6130740.1 Dcp1-like decapping [Penicillium capsulatum]
MSSRKPRRNNPANHHNQNHNHLTDYESDAAYLSDMQQLQSAPPLRSNEELNLAVLRRHNPSITLILSLANYAVIYIFSPTSRAWEKTSIEGSLFVCQLTPGSLGEERYTAFILNRRGLDNFDLPLTDGENVELTDEYVIVRQNEETDAEYNSHGKHENGMKTSDKIFGIWIYSEPPPNSTSETRTINAQLIMECAAHAGQSLKLARERLGAMRQDGMHVAAAAAEAQTAPMQEVQASVPMGRQVSLKDLFGQQRAQDDGWSVRAHHLSPAEQQQQQYQQQQQHYQQQMQYQMQMQPGMMPPQHPPHPPPQPQLDVLGNLFRRAGLAYQDGPGH